MIGGGEIMGVYIKGMEMPKDGVYWCEIGVADDIATITIHGEERKSFPLLSVPDHGDLIDRDKLCKEMTDFCGKQHEEAAYTGNRLVRISWDDAYNFVKNAPVVIPAEKEEVDE